MSKILDLHAEDDSVNYDGIVAVTPPPSGEYQHHLVVSE